MKKEDFLTGKTEYVMQPPDSLDWYQATVIMNTMTDLVSSVVGTTTYMSVNTFIDEIGLEYTNRGGNLSRRIINFLWKIYHVKPTDAFLNDLSNLIKSYKASGDIHTIYYDVVDHFDWCDGMFGKGGSCWWDDYIFSRATFQDNDGMCLRRYRSASDKHGDGRVWFFIHKDGLVFFNFYGWEVTEVAEIAKNVWGIKHPMTSIGLHNRESCTPYINAGSKAMFSGINNWDDVYVDWKVIEYNKFDYEYYDHDDEDYSYCYGCDNRFHIDDLHYVDDNEYCYRCYERRFFYCNECCSDYRKDYLGHDGMCEDCSREKGYIKCTNCDEWVDDSIHVDTENAILTPHDDGGDLCTYCFSISYAKCDHCGIIMDKAYIHPGILGFVFCSDQCLCNGVVDPLPSYEQQVSNGQLVLFQS